MQIEMSKQSAACERVGKATLLEGAVVSSLWKLSAQAEPDVVLRSAYALPTTSTEHKVLDYLNDQLRQRTKGRVEIETYPCAQQGEGEHEVIKYIQLANIDTLVSSATLSRLKNNFYILYTPLTFNKLESSYFTTRSEMGKRH